MRKVLSISLVLAVALAGSAFAKPADMSGSLDKFQFMDLSNQSSDWNSASNLGVFGSAQAGTTYFGGTVWAADSSRWEAIADSCWTFDTGVGSNFNHADPNVNPFKNNSLHAYMEGWIGYDNSFGGANPYFRRLTEADFPGAVCVGATGGLSGLASLYAGVLPAEADAECFAAGQGYGDAWNVRIEKSFAYGGSGSVTLAYDYVSDTEPGFDYSVAYVDTTGLGDLVAVAVYTGPASGSASINLGLTELPSVASTIKIVFSVESDGAYSDQDGSYPTICGALAVDNVALSGAITSGPDTFEGGADGWVLSAPAPGAGGEWSDIVALSDLPATLTPCDCDLVDSVLVFQDLTIGGGGHGLFQDNLAASPWIDLRAAGLAGAPGKFIQFNGYFELPLLNYIFVQTNVQWYPAVCANTGKLYTSTFQSDGFVRYFGGIPTCTTVGGAPTRLEYSTVADVGAEQMRIAIGVLSYCRFFGNCTGVTNSTPWFDQVKLGVYGSPDAPFLNAGTTDTPFDSFPENGTLRIDAPGRLDSNNVKGQTSPEPGSSLGDTLIVNGGSGGAEVRVQFAVTPGPGINAVALNSWLTSHQVENVWYGQQWYSARMDTAQQASSDAVVNGTWMTAYHEADPNFSGTDIDPDLGDLDPAGVASRVANDIFPDDLFTPGTRVNLFYKTQFDGSFTPFTGAWFTNPDTTGGATWEMEVMPASMAADSTWNCILYVDHFDGRGAQPFIEAALGAVVTGGSNNFENTPWDRWDVSAPSSQQGSFGRPLNTEYGANVVQTFAYKTIVWNSGNLNSFNLVEEDANVLIPWLTLVDTGLGNNNLYVSGDGAAQSMTQEAASEPSARSLLEDWMGVTFTCGTVRDPSCPPGSGIQDLVACIETDPVGGDFVGNDGPNTVVFQGNGCPQLRSFDLLGISVGAAGTPTGNEQYDSVPKGPLAYSSISNEATGGPDYKTVIDAVSIHYRRDAATCAAPEPGPIQDRMDRVMTWFGYAGAGLACADPTAATGLGDFVGREPVFKTALSNFAPNPLVGAAQGRIQFTMSRDGSAAIDVFDVNGRLVRTVFDGVAKEGVNEAFWNGTDASERPVASGVYFYRLRANGDEFSKKLVVVQNGN